MKRLVELGTGMKDIVRTLYAAQLHAIYMERYHHVKKMAELEHQLGIIDAKIKANTQDMWRSYEHHR